MISTVIKRDGTVEDFDVDKLNHWAIWASENCGISWTDIVFGAVRACHDNVTTQQLQDELIKTCINFRTDEHTKVAARLLIGSIYKEAFDDFSVPHLPEYYHYMVESGLWFDMGYTDEELETLDEIIDHTVDFTYEYATLKQFVDKYALRSHGKLLESPQMMMMGLAMSNNRAESHSTRIDSVIRAYKQFSNLTINLPTPTLALERTESLPAPSCCVISGDDNVGSIGAATHVAYDMTAKSAGIGIELRTRAPKDPVKNGRIEHGGKYSYFSYIDRAVKANRQVVRGGSATVTIHALDPEIMELLGMRSQRTDSTYRLDQMDYSFAVNELFLKKVANNENWMSVSPYFAPKLWELSYSGDKNAFEEEYNRVFNSTVKKVVQPARDIIKKWITNRADHGRLYILFLDNVNSHTPFCDEIRLSNLCQEICIPTSGFADVVDLYKYFETDGEVGLCNLASIVVSRVRTLEEYIEAAYVAAKTVDNCIEHGVYPFPNIEYSAKARRSIGIGMTDLAHLMAREGYTYDSLDGRNFIHRLAEMHSYALHKASVRLAKERGRCEWFERTKYANEKPWLPIDTYAKGVDEHHTQELLMDWEGLREEIKKYGVRFSVHEAFMPVESSSVFTASTNGVYPIRRREIFKSSPKGMVYFRCPGIGEYHYQNAFKIKDTDLVSVYGIIQKFTGQAISSDFYTIMDGDEQLLSMRGMINRILKASKCGMKTMYYENFKTGKEVLEEDGGAVEVSGESDCEDCRM